jgi:cysteine synthase A
MKSVTPSRLRFDKPGRGRVYDSVLETIGNTPLVRLARLPQKAGCKAEVLAKLEFFNPMGSVKDRIAVAMIEAMEADGSISPGSVIVGPLRAIPASAWRLCAPPGAIAASSPCPTA